jgi:RNA polymerase sigma factor (TIGR02999 family)
MRDLTTILRAAAGGDAEASSELLPLVYEELRRLAAAKMDREPPGHTLQPTALVHEAYLRLFGDNGPIWENRAHFFAAAGGARRHGQLKRGGGRARVPLSEDLPDPAPVDDPLSALAVDEALGKLEQFDPRLADIVKLRCFVGMSIAETAQSLGLSSRTVNREWLVAKAWLAKELGVGPRA